MGEQTKLTALQRMAGAGADAREGAGMTPAKAFRLALSKAAEAEFALALQLSGFAQDRLKLDVLLDNLPKESMLMLLDGPDGSRAVAALDIQLVAALIEVQTIGYVAASSANPRPTTRTDSIMCEPFVSRVLQELGGHLSTTGAARWACGFSGGERVESLRHLGLVLEDVEYRLFQLTLDIAEGAKTGTLLLALPAEGRAKTVSGQDGADWGLALERAVNGSQAEINAVLYRLNMPLSEVTGFKPGDLLQVPVAAISDVALEALDGMIVGRARLGQQQGFRAVRIKGEEAQTRIATATTDAMGVADATGLPGTDPLTAQMPDTLAADPAAFDAPVSELPQMPSDQAAPLAGGLGAMPPETAALPDDGPEGEQAADLAATDMDMADLADITMSPMPMQQDLQSDDLSTEAMPMELEIS